MLSVISRHTTYPPHAWQKLIFFSLVFLGQLWTHSWKTLNNRQIFVRKRQRATPRNKSEILRFLMSRPLNLKFLNHIQNQQTFSTFSDGVFFSHFEYSFLVFVWSIKAHLNSLNSLFMESPDSELTINCRCRIVEPLMTNKGRMWSWQGAKK